MTKFNPKTHIIGKVYDLTQENMNAMLLALQNEKDTVVKLIEVIEEFMKFDCGYSHNNLDEKVKKVISYYRS